MKKKNFNLFKSFNTLDENYKISFRLIISVIFILFFSCILYIGDHLKGFIHNQRNIYLFEEKLKESGFNSIDEMLEQKSKINEYKEK